MKAILASSIVLCLAGVTMAGNPTNIDLAGALVGNPGVASGFGILDANRHGKEWSGSLTVSHTNIDGATYEWVANITGGHSKHGTTTLAATIVFHGANDPGVDNVAIVDDGTTVAIYGVSRDGGNLLFFFNLE